MENKFGKLSKLHLTAAKKDGRTIIEDLSFTAPFKIMRPFYEKKEFMTVMLLTASAGIMAGDRQEWELLVRENANLEFTSQAYEKIHKMEDGWAERRAHITVEPSGCLYYTPLPTIPFAGSDFRNILEVNLADDSSRFCYSEILSCGRAAHGEEFRYRRYQNLVTVFRNGRMVYRDNTLYEPSQMDMRGFGMYEGFTHLANLLICGEEKTDDWIREVRAMLDEPEGMEGGVTRTAAGHIAIRILGRSGQQLTCKIEQILAL
ncbi:MAG: urease accessory protein UreD [Lachnospiraceae bacterium]|nr:urease accessory protein UreD [Lachnospiraceae bacterium]